MLGETTLCFHLDVLYREEKFKVVWVAKHDFRWARKFGKLLYNCFVVAGLIWIHVRQFHRRGRKGTQRNQAQQGFLRFPFSLPLLAEFFSRSWPDSERHGPATDFWPIHRRCAQYSCWLQVRWFSSSFLSGRSTRSQPR